MIKKGIILAGGKGTRMSPLTKAVNKQLLPIYDKPLIFYPLSILMLAKIKDVLIIVNKGQLEQYKKIIPNGNNLGIKITYKEQATPKGLPDAFILGEKFIAKSNVALILGDNFFYGQNLSTNLINSAKLKKGAKVLLHKVNNPELFGVAKINNKNKIVLIKEKPKKNLSDLAITGLYFFDNKVVKYAKSLKPSKRGELEIVDIHLRYLNNETLKVVPIQNEIAWFDTGDAFELLDASNYVAKYQKDKKKIVGAIEIVALQSGWINKMQFKQLIDKMPTSDYKKSMKSFIG